MRSSEEQLTTFKGILRDRQLSKDSPVFAATISWIKEWPKDLKNEDRVEIRLLICQAFSLSQSELDSVLSTAPARRTTATMEEEDFDDGRKIEAEFDSLLPRSGFFRKYIEYTRNSEAPMPYHFFTAMVGLGATVNRRVWVEMGYFNIYPTLGVILLGPSGIKKTSSADIMVHILQEMELVKIYSEKLTPEALIDAMRGDNATGLVYAPEMSVFLSKQKYMEGIVPLITRFMDCPDIWESGTIGRGECTLRNVAISSLMCSTPDWFISNTPEDMFGGGFIARNLLIVQNSSPRIFPRPKPGDPTLRESLGYDLAAIHEFNGEMEVSGATAVMYDEWYRESKIRNKDTEHELLSTYFERKPSHTLRLAMCLHLGQCADLQLCCSCFERATKILAYMEKFLPSLLRQMFKSAVGAEQELVLKTIKSAGGEIGHSDLVRRMQYKMRARQVSEIIASLKEAGYILEDKNSLSRIYTITGEGQNNG